MNDQQFIARVAQRAGTDLEGAGAITYAVFQELRERITPKEALDVASQLPPDLQVLWLENERLDRRVRKTHETEFVARVRYFASLTDSDSAERSVRAVFATLQEALGSPNGTEGEAWDIFSQLPKDLKKLWLSATRHPPSPYCKKTQRGTIMPIGVVHTPEDEESWKRAKEIAANEYPFATGSNYWRIVMGIYKKMTNYEPKSEHGQRDLHGA